MQNQIVSAIMQWLSGMVVIFVILPIKTILQFFKFVLIDIPMMAGKKDDDIHK
jgi:hypothetical protein